MEDYNKIIESLGVRYIKARHIKLLQPAYIKNYYDVENTFILLYEGNLSYGPKDNRQTIKSGEMLFIPGGKLTELVYGENSPGITNEDFVSNREKYFAVNKDISRIGNISESFAHFTFDAKVFDSVNFFASLDIPPFVIADYPDLVSTMNDLLREDLANYPGKERMIKLKTEELVVGVIRYILQHKLFVEQLATNSTYFKDPRLIDIFAFIKEELGGDLSNKVLANVANVSEDYVGQYFKMLTGINPQDYIEYQRMEKAVHLLRTTKKSIREIGSDVGYKDTAYFCRRFKMMFGIPAGKMRRRETLLNA
ncbi:MAG: helix-turn-helix transcriptional regulator [Verrucomicrobia bacterium]|nr:helix-turn-helix transcriptional regulator [Cytophagales bacterium]